MGINAQYLGMSLMINDLDTENLQYFAYCADHAFHLQACTECARLRYPPTTACPWCSNRGYEWKPVEGVGTVHSYVEVCHAIQPGFATSLPYIYMLVDLDTQKGQPTEQEALRVVGNLVNEDGTLASPEMVAKLGIGSRVRMVFSDVIQGLSLPQWTIVPAEAGDQPAWRYQG
jgi:uncharacterized protein